MALIKAGVCVHLLTVGQERPHLYAVLNDPFGDPPRVCLVNFSTSIKSDKTTTLKPDEPHMHPFVTRETYMVYAWAKLIDFNQIEAIVNKDISKRHHKACSPVLLERIKKGLLESPFTTPEVLEFCKAAFRVKVPEVRAAKPRQPTDSPVKPKRGS